MSPRKPGSAWSGVNKEKGRVRRLTEAELMAPAGLLAAERAKKDGSWERPDTALSEPPDLLAASAARPSALEAWRGFPPPHRRANLEWIAQAKRPETRAARVAEIAAHAKRGERADTWPRLGGPFPLPAGLARATGLKRATLARRRPSPARLSNSSGGRE
jgi:uncharacterized protein YdeI (YjbR/CyaY-like superfamily)